MTFHLRCHFCKNRWKMKGTLSLRCPECDSIGTNYVTNCMRCGRLVGSDQQMPIVIREGPDLGDVIGRVCCGDDHVPASKNRALDGRFYSNTIAKRSFLILGT